MRRILVSAAVLLAVGAFMVFTLGASHGSSAPTYNIELDNAFGLVSGADFKVAGVIAGSIKSINLCYTDKAAHCENPLHALVTVSISQQGFGAFHQDAFCQSRPQSLIGEYFVDCDPGTQGKTLPAGSTITASHTQSTIPADLVQDIMRLPYRERFSIIINELGAAVAARSEDLQTALRRADPALAETDNLLNLLANDASTIRDLNVNADSVINALANNSTQVQRFITAANRTATISASQAPAIQATWEKLPAFLQELRPALQKLGAAADAQDPVFQNLNSASSNLNQFFHLLVPFSHESVPSLQSLGNASAVGQSAVKAATPAVAHLNEFAKPTPELAQNLAIVLHALDAHQRDSSAGGPVEADPRSPNGGRGYSGLEGVLQYVFNITNAIDYYGPWGHMLGVDAFANSTCSSYATPVTIAKAIQQYQSTGGNLNADVQANPRTCYAFLGPNQPGVNEPDPTWSTKDATPANPSACVPDPGGYPLQGYGTKYYGPNTNACKLTESPLPSASRSSAKHGGASSVPAALPSGGGAGSSGTSLPAPPSLPSLPKGGVGGVLGAVSGIVGGLVGRAHGPLNKATGAVGQATGGSSGGSTASQAQQLLNYLLAP
jgi:phospholipid/cholesterol/gamma-HCH transport system substrate-binding protein